MSHAVGPERIETRRMPEGMLYRLPKRDLGAARRAGWVLVAFGAVVTGFMVFWMWGPIEGALRGDGPIHWFFLIFGLLGLPGLGVGLIMMGVGLAIAMDALRSDVLIGREELVAVEWFGPAPWRRKRRLADIERLVLSCARGSADEDDAEAAERAAAAGLELQAIRVEGKRIKPLVIAPGYSKILLEGLARQLAAAVEAGRPGRLFADGPAERIAVVDETEPEPVEIEDLLRSRPAGSAIVLQEHATGVSLMIPPRGLVRGSKGLFAASVFWLLFCLAIFGVIGFGALRQEEGTWGAVVVLASFAALFIGIGVAMLLAGVQMGLGQAALITDGDRLSIKRVGPLRSREDCFRAAEVAGIRVGPSGMEVNDVPVRELQIHPRTGKKVGLLSQLDDAELEWVAGVLRRALGVGRSAER